MKKTILALTIPALFATSASAVTVYSDEGAQVDIYGRVQFEAGAQGYQKVKTNEAENFGGVGEARLGVNVKYMLNNDVDLIGKLEWQVTAESENNNDGAENKDIDARYAWAGFRFMDTTDLTVGRVNSPYAQLLDYTDVLNVFGGIAAYGDTLGTTDKVDDMVRLAYAANGVDLRAGYSFNDADKQDGNLAEEDRWSVSAGYTLPMGLGFGAAYEQIAFGNGADQDNWIAGVNYTLDGLYVAAIYTAQEKDAIGGGKNETDGYELHAQYTVDAWTVLAQYSNEEYDAAGSTNTVDTVDAITLGAQYSLTPKAKLYAEYLINDIGDKDDLYGVGIQYNF